MASFRLDHSYSHPLQISNYLIFRVMESGGGPPLPPGGRGGRGEALRALLAKRQVGLKNVT